MMFRPANAAIRDEKIVVGDACAREGTAAAQRHNPTNGPGAPME